MSATFPRRVVGLEAARSRWGERADALARAYWLGDPGDPRREPPAWVDLERLERAGVALRRYGLLTAMVLRCYALPLSYRSPVGVMPLVHTGALVDQAFPRLYRTAEYVVETQAPGAWVPGGPAWATGARVREGHEAVRRALRAAGWDESQGAPIPQPDVLATALLFGPLTVEGLRGFGVQVPPPDADAVAHLARVMAWTQGADEGLLVDGHEASLDVFRLITALHGPPSEHGRELMRALLDIPLVRATRRRDRLLGIGLRRVYGDFSAHLLGEDARGLGVVASGRLGRWVAAGASRWAWPTSHIPLHDGVVRGVLDRGRARLRGV